MLPTIIPFRANSLDGIKGSSTGVRKAPDKIPETSASIDIITLSHMCEKEKIPGPMPAMIKSTNAVIKAGFRMA